MNREFEDWLDAKIKEHVPPNQPITKESLATIVRDALVHVSTVEEVLRLDNEKRKIEHVFSQLDSTYRDVIDQIRDCCGLETNPRGCTGAGCEFLKRIAVQLRSVLPKEQGQ